MEQNRTNAGALAGLEQIHMSTRARTHVERQIRFAAMIVDMVIGKTPAQTTPNASVAR